MSEPSLSNYDKEIWMFAEQEYDDPVAGKS